MKTFPVAKLATGEAIIPSNKKYQPMLTRRAKAYSSSGSVV